MQLLRYAIKLSIHPAKGVRVKSPSRVRIPLSPPDISFRFRYLAGDACPPVSDHRSITTCFPVAVTVAMLRLERLGAVRIAQYCSAIFRSGRALGTRNISRRVP